jgi:hypothetical protein
MIGQVIAAVSTQTPVRDEGEAAMQLLPFLVGSGDCCCEHPDPERRRSKSSFSGDLS